MDKEALHKKIEYGIREREDWVIGIEKKNQEIRMRGRED
jgi:low affinity Fe/Cu permease